MLDLAVVLALSAQCAPGVSPQVLTAIAHAESRFDPLAIGVNHGPAVGRPKTRAEAARTARRLMAAGMNIDLGLAQINSSNLAWLRLSVEDAFDPCRNLSAAGTVLRAGYTPEGSNDRQHALRVALSRYNTGHAERGFRNGYVARVEAASRQLGLREFSPTTVHPSRIDVVRARPASSPPPPRAWDVFARARSSAVAVFAPTIPTQTWSAP